MIKYVKVLLSVLLLFLGGFFGVSQSSDIVEGCLPLTVSFTAPTGTSSHYWDFDDASTANIANPSNTFLNAGTYNVTYREVPTGPIIGTIVVDVYAKPVPSFTALNDQGCAPLNVNFNNSTVLNNGITINNLTWVFSDGGNTTGQNPSYLFNLAGSYNVSLSITTNFPSCDASQQYVGVVNASDPPSVSVITNPNPAVGCTSPMVVSFQNTSFSQWGPLTYNWDLDNNNTSTLLTPPDQTYTTGDYTVNLVATDTNGCSDSVETFVSVSEPIANFLVDDTVCINTSIVLVNQSSTGLYTWTFDAGTSLTTSNLINPTISFSTPGYHNIQLEVFGACASDTIITVFVENVDATFTSVPSFSCVEPLSVQLIPNDLNGAIYDWTLDADSSTNVVSPTYDYFIGDTNDYTRNAEYYFNPSLTVTSSFGCMSTFTLQDTIHKPNALFFTDEVDGCVPLTVNFKDSSTAASNIISWEWHFGDGTIVTSANDQDQSHTYNTVGEFNAFLVINTADGCTDTSYNFTIFVGDNITPDLAVTQTTVCPGEIVTFTDATTGIYADSIDAWHYYSEESRQYSCSDQSSSIWSYHHQTGGQDVTMVVGFNGCFSQRVFNNLVTVNGPIAGIDYTLSCDSPQIVNFSNTSQDATSYLWNFGDGSTSTSTNPTHTYASSGDYLVSLIAYNATSGCAEDTAFMTVYIRHLKAGIAMDTLICQGAPIDINAASSEDVFEACNRGYIWYFSDPQMRPLMTDDTTSEMAFNQTGINEIMLVVKDVNNCVDTARISVKVYGMNSNFSMSDSTFCLPVSVDHINLSTSDTTIVGWEWIFADGETSSDTNKLYNYLEPDSIKNPTETSLVTTNILGCVDTMTIDVVVYKPESIISADDNTICSGSTVEFQATDFTTFGSNLDFDWNFDNGSTSLLQNPTNTFDNEGVYNVWLVYEEVSTGCKDSSSFDIEVRNYPEADFSSTADAGSYACPNDNIIFTNTSTSASALTYSWDFGNGLFSTIKDPGTTYMQNGDYTVKLYAVIPAPFNCIDSITKTITVLQPDGDFTADIGDDTICRLETVIFTLDTATSAGQYYWDFGDGTGAGQVDTVSHQYTFVPPSGKTLAKLIMSNPDGSCPVTKTQPIHIFEVTADFIRNGNDIDTAICPQPYPFENASLNATTFYWDFGDGQTSTLNNPGDHQYDTSGTYEVTLGVKSTELTCTDTISKMIVILKNPEVNIIDDTICEGEFAQIYQFNPNTLHSYLWTSDSPISTVNITSSFLTEAPEVSTTYYLTITDENSCSDTDTGFVKVYNKIVLPDFDTTIVVGDIIALPMPYDFDDYTFEWNPETGLSCLDCPNPEVQPLNDIEYSITISDNFDCFNEEAIFNVKVHPETFISLPTTFTPNGDGNNDILYVEGWGIKELTEFKIYNRWGALVFETTDKEVGWNGYFNGILQNNDVYLVQVVGKTWRDEEKTISQYINLVR